MRILFFSPVSFRWADVITGRPRSSKLLLVSPEHGHLCGGGEEREEEEEKEKEEEEEKEKEGRDGCCDAAERSEKETRPRVYDGGVECGPGEEAAARSTEGRGCTRAEVTFNVSRHAAQGTVSLRLVLLTNLAPISRQPPEQKLTEPYTPLSTPFPLPPFFLSSLSLAIYTCTRVRRSALRRGALIKCYSSPRFKSFSLPLSLFFRGASLFLSPISLGRRGFPHCTDDVIRETDGGCWSRTARVRAGYGTISAYTRADDAPLTVFFFAALSSSRIAIFFHRPLGARAFPGNQCTRA